MSGKIHSYPKVLSLGSKGLEDLSKGYVVIEEKIDGSQFSFGVVGGRLVIRSHYQLLDLSTKDKKFGSCIDYVKLLYEEKMLTNNVIYRAEAMCSPKQNRLRYDRCPKRHMIIFDIELLDLETNRWEFIKAADVKSKCALALEIEPAHVIGIVPAESITEDYLNSLIDKESILGGPKWKEW